MTQVVFDPAAFIVSYPLFAAVPAPTLQGYFNQATLYLSNSDNSPVQDITRRTILLNMLVAHVGQLSGALSADGSSAPVGAVNSASEGSVSIGVTTAQATPGTPIWFQQTQAGAAFWQATSSLRSFRYRPRPTIVC